MLDMIQSAVQKKLRKYFSYYDPTQEGYEQHFKFHNLGLEAKERFFLAANRIGKTRSASLEIAMHMTGYYPSWWKGYKYKYAPNVWVCGVNVEINSVLEKRYFEGIDEDPWIDPELIIHQNKMVHSYKVQHITGGISRIRFKTYEQGREKFQAEKVDILHFDEEPPFDIYTEGLTRTVSTSLQHHGMTLITATPLKGQTNMILHFQHEKGSDIVLSPEIINNSKVYIVAGWENAPHIPLEERERLIKSYSPHEVEARTKGIPSLGSGMVYPISESLITCEPFEIPDFWPRVFGLDFGWKDPTACVFAAHDRDNDVIYLYGEYAVSELTPQHHANQLIKQGADWMFGVYDPAGKISNQKDGSKLVDLYREAGLKYLSKADNAREVGIQKVLQRMQNGKLFIFKSLTKTLREYRMYARNEEGIIKDGNDHLMDCIRYIIMSGLPLAKIRSRSKWEIPNFSDSTGIPHGNIMYVNGRWING